MPMCPNQGLQVCGTKLQGHYGEYLLLSYVPCSIRRYIQGESRHSRADKEIRGGSQRLPRSCCSGLWGGDMEGQQEHGLDSTVQLGARGD